MYILVYESTGPHASVAIIDQNGHIIEKTSKETLNHLTRLLPMTEEILKEAGIDKKDISCVAVSAGPGSFTGIRIGVTTARAIAQTLGIGTISVDTLKSFAYADREFDGNICAMIDARRNSCYGGVYRWENGRPKEIVKAAPYDVDEFLDEISGMGSPCIFFGDGSRKYAEKISEMDCEVKLADEDDYLQKAEYVALSALDIFEEEGTVSYDKLVPVYMRKSEAERKREEKLKNESAGN